MHNMKSSPANCLCRGLTNFTDFQVFTYSRCNRNFVITHCNFVEQYLGNVNMILYLYKTNKLFYGPLLDHSLVLTSWLCLPVRNPQTWCLVYISWTWTAKDEFTTQEVVIWFGFVVTYFFTVYGCNQVTFHSQRFVMQHPPAGTTRTHELKYSPFYCSPWTKSWGNPFQSFSSTFTRVYNFFY